MFGGIEPISVTVDELQFVEHRRFLISEISSIFAVPADAFVRYGEPDHQAENPHEAGSRSDHREDVHGEGFSRGGRAQRSER